LLALVVKHAYTIGMLKQDVISIAGGTSKLAQILGITSQAVSMWPSVLTDRQRHEVIGAFAASGRYTEIVSLIPSRADMGKCPQQAA
jgi:hypothetical protein